MRAMAIQAPGEPLRPVDIPDPEPGPGQRLLRVRACGVCRTDLHIVDGEIDVGAQDRGRIVPGHQIVGEDVATGERVGVPWLGWTDGTCRFCASGRENLCDAALFTGHGIDGGYAELTVADERFCFPLPDGLRDLQAAPLLCAGLIGYRALGLCGDGERLGLYGFGAAANIVAQVALWQGRRSFAFVRPGDAEAVDFAREIGAEWAGGSDEL